MALIIVCKIDCLNPSETLSLFPTNSEMLNHRKKHKFQKIENKSETFDAKNKIEENEFMG